MEIIKGLPREDYDSIDAINASRLALILKSPKYFERNIFKESDAMKLGTAIHTAYLEPTDFKARYLVEPDSVECVERIVKSDGTTMKKPGGKLVWQPVNKRMKDHKEWLDNWRKSKEAGGSIVITPDDMGAITGVLNSITEELRFPPPKDCIPIQELLATRDVEVTVVNEMFGHKVKARADLLVNTRLGRTVVDIKKCRDLSPEMFKLDLFKLHYDMKAAFYKKAFEADHFVWICVGAEEPYPVATYSAEHFIDIGNEKVKKCFEIKKRCEDENYWPWYTRGIEALTPSNWQMSQYFENLGGEIE